MEEGNIHPRQRFYTFHASFYDKNLCICRGGDKKVSRKKYGKNTSSFDV